VQPDDLVAVESAPLDYIQTDDDDTVVVDLTRAKRHGGYGELTANSILIVLLIAQSFSIIAGGYGKLR